ncbi:MAG: hypothetical protein HGA85_04685 [Nanoarchaeota archaeon]|nr:hypothetical protein [Nanoarchaeota archaeon]
MPPILSKNPQLQIAMRRGDIDLANKVLAQETILKGGNYPIRCQAHMFAEAEKIREFTLYMKQRYDPSVPLTEKFTDVDTSRIKGKATFRNYNILVVENDLDMYGHFTRRIVSALDSDGRYGGTQVFSDYNLHSCMQLCETGQVDLVLFDWTNPSIYESLMVGGGTHIPGESFGRKDTTLSFDDDGGIYGLTDDGSMFDEDKLREEAERLDIRSLWMDKISAYCLEAGKQPPPYFIFRSGAEYRDISKIISQKLGNSIK